MTDKANYTQTYWCNKGKYPEIKTALEKLVPGEGSVVNAKKNRVLEKFRKASNCYYDLYNNGLCNRAAEFRRVFGFDGHYGRGGLTQTIVDRTEAEMDRIILAAAKEQGITLPEGAEAQAEVDRLSSELASNHDKLTKIVSELKAKKPHVQLTGENGNAFVVIGSCSKALKNAGLTVAADAFREKCFAAKSYDEVLQLAMQYCDVD
jgi:hypothetical protein